MRTVELDEIDRLLTRYGGAESRIAANLVDLDSNSTYKLITSKALTGTTAKQLATAMDGAPKLWGWYIALQETLDTARSMRGTGGLNASKRQSMAAWLTGKSVDLSGHSVESLGVGSEDRISIEQLLTRIRETYEPVIEGVSEVDQVWRDLLPRAEAARATLRQVEADFEELGVSDYAVQQGHEQLEMIEAALLTDPLSLGSDAGAALDDLVSQAARVADRFRKGHDELDSDMAQVQQLLAEIRLVRSQASAALAETNVKIKDPQGLVRIPSAEAIDGPNGLASRAHDLLTQTDLPWQTIRQRLDLWLTTARKFRTQLGKADDKNEQPLRDRDELRGLLTAYQAKLHAMGLAEEPAVDDLADEAHNELYTTPCDLDRAAVLVERVGQALSGNGQNLPSPPPGDGGTPE